jgi:hypothetical protein
MVEDGEESGGMNDDRRSLTERCVNENRENKI